MFILCKISLSGMWTRSVICLLLIKHGKGAEMSFLWLYSHMCVYMYIYNTHKYIIYIYAYVDINLYPHWYWFFLCHCYCSVAKLCTILWDHTHYNTTDVSVHYLTEFAQIHVHWVNNDIEPSHPLLPSSTFAINFSQYQGLFQWVSSSSQVAKELELQHQSFQWIFQVDFL